MPVLIIALFISFLFSVALAKLTIWFYQKQGWLKNHSKNHIKRTHDKLVPRGGGIPIFISFILSSCLFLSIDKYLVAIALSAFLLTVIGILDDIFNLHPLWRILIGLIATLIVVGAGIGIAYVTNPFGPGVLHLDQPRLRLLLLSKHREIWIIADLFAMIFILWNMNAVNWSKGVDGQLPSFVVVAFIFIGLLSQTFSSDPTQFNNAVLSFILAGSYLGLLIFNWYPQKMMPGYGAGSLAGFFLSILAILSGAKLATTLMVLAIPTADAVFTIFRRIFTGKSPFWGDRGHLHHQLLDQFGWGKRRIALFYSVISLTMGLLALTLNTTGKLITLGLVFTLVLGLQLRARLSFKQKPSKI